MKSRPNYEIYASGGAIGAPEQLHSLQQPYGVESSSQPASTAMAVDVAVRAVWRSTHSSEETQLAKPVAPGREKNGATWQHAVGPAVIGEISIR